MKGGQKMIWEEMDYNKPKLTMTQRLSYERELELFDIDGSDNYNDLAMTELDRNYDKFVSQMKEGYMIAAE